MNFKNKIPGYNIKLYIKPCATNYNYSSRNVALKKCMAMACKRICIKSEYL